MLFSKKRDDYYLSIYKSQEKDYNNYQEYLFSKEKIPYAKDFDKENIKRIKDIKLFYGILNEVQKEENKVTYLITFTNLKNIDTYNKIVSSFNKRLLNLKNLKSFSSLEFMYFSIIEPSKKGISHLHIKLVSTKIRGLRTKLDDIVSKLTNSFKDIKKQDNSDKRAYLTKVLTEDKYKQYIMWLEENDCTLNKAVKRSTYIKINDEIKITLKEYKKILYKLINAQKKSDRKYISFEDVKKYLIEKSDSKISLNTPIIGCLLKKQKYKSEQTMYSIYNQVLIHEFLKNYKDIKNNSPNS